MAPLIEKIANKLKESLIEKAEEGKSIDSKDIYISYFIEVVSSCAFGIEMNNQSSRDKEMFMMNARRLPVQAHIFFFTLLTVLPAKLIKLFNFSIFDEQSMNFFKEVTSKAIKMRESGNQKKNDFLQLMLDALKAAKDSSEPEPVPNDENETENVPTKQSVKAVLTPDGVLAQALLFLIAGIDGSSTTLSLVSYALTVNPECQQKLQEEVDRVLENNEGKVDCNTTGQMTYLDMVINETLRMYPPAIRLDRYCSNDTKIENYVIPKGMFITIPVYAIHHDEEFYPDPFRFDPERFNPENKESRNPYTFLPFGLGPRNCIGMRFAVMLLKLTLVHVLKDFSFVRSEETPEKLTYKKGNPNLRTEKPLIIKIERRMK